MYALAAAYHPEIRLDKLRPGDWAMRRKRLESAEPVVEALAPAPVKSVQKARQTLAKDGWEL